MLFIIGLPVAQIFLFCISIGKDPVGLKVAIINNELNSSMQSCIPPTGCEWTLLSCRYLHHLQKRTEKFLPYDDEEDGRNAVRNGWAWASITFPSNYSDALRARIEDGRYAADWDVEYAEMQIVMDMSGKSRKFLNHIRITDSDSYLNSHIVLRKISSLHINDLAIFREYMYNSFYYLLILFLLILFR